MRIIGKLSVVWLGTVCCLLVGCGDRFHAFADATDKHIQDDAARWSLDWVERYPSARYALGTGRELFGWADQTVEMVDSHLPTGAPLLEEQFVYMRDRAKWIDPIALVFARNKNRIAVAADLLQEHSFIQDEDFLLGAGVFPEVFWTNGDQLTVHEIDLGSLEPERRAAFEKQIDTLFAPTPSGRVNRGDRPLSFDGCNLTMFALSSPRHGARHWHLILNALAYADAPSSEEGKYTWLDQRIAAANRLYHAVWYQAHGDDDLALAALGRPVVKPAGSNR